MGKGAAGMRCTRACLSQQESMREESDSIQRTVAEIAWEVKETSMFVLLESYMRVSLEHLRWAKVGQAMTTSSSRRGGKLA
jgi:hypothetical protein